MPHSALMSSGAFPSGCLDNGSIHEFSAAIRQTVQNTVRGPSIPKFHPHSLPEYHDGLACGSPYNLSRTFSNGSGTMGSRLIDSNDSGYPLGFGSPGKLTDFNGGMSIGFLYYHGRELF